MKYVLAAILIVLLAASALTAWNLPDARSAVPVIRWVTDNNPARVEQISLFQKWLVQTHGPAGIMRLDVANGDPTKKIIQSVSGVAGDVMDVTNAQPPYFNAIGFLADLTSAAKELGFDPTHTYPSIKPLIGVTDDAGRYHQLTFPCNVVTDMLIVNRASFRRFQQPDPPSRWSLDEFETRGIAYVKAANRAGASRQFYFSVQPDLVVMRRSLGVGDFDETQTHCTLDDPRYADLLNRVARWRRLHLLPSKADEASFSSGDSQYGGRTTYLFDKGNYAMLYGGRYLIIALRDANIGRVRQGLAPLDLAVVEPPNGGLPNVAIATRAAAVYKETKDFSLACHFLSFLASAEYGEQIIDDGDALPPNPTLTHSQLFLHPAENPDRGIYGETEWNFHGPFAEAAEHIAIPRSISPFILGSIVDREDVRARDRFLEGEDVSAAQVIHEEQIRIDSELRRMISENPSLQPRYHALCLQQDRIAALKAAGEKIPLAMIIDPYRRVDDVSKGLTN